MGVLQEPGQRGTEETEGGARAMRDESPAFEGEISQCGGEDESDVWFTQTVEIGRYEGRPVALGSSREPPGAPAPDDFGVNLFVPNERGGNVDVVRIDTAHDGCHVDRLYLSEGDRLRRDYGLTLRSPEAVVDWLLEDERWRTFVELYDEHHGLPQTAMELRDGR